METGYDYFGARYYDSRIGRWLQVDPLADKYLGVSCYNYTINNPLKFIDPNGANLGKYYDEYGNYIGNDRKNDNKNYVVPNQNYNEVSTLLNMATSMGSEGLSALETVSNSIRMPSLEAIEEMKANLDGISDPQNIEASGYIAQGKDGQDVEISAAYGEVSADGTRSESVPTNLKSSESGQISQTTGIVNYYYHSHPSGSWYQQPSNKDIINASTSYIPSISNMVLGTGNNMIYFYNGNGIKATFPLNKFFMLK